MTQAGLPTAAPPRPLRVAIVQPDVGPAPDLVDQVSQSMTTFGGFTSIEVVAVLTERPGATATSAATAAPDAVVIQVGADRAGLRTVTELHRRHPVVAIVAVSGDDAQLFAALQLGARSAVGGPEPELSLGRLLAGTVHGESHLTPGTATALIDEYARLDAHAEAVLAPAPELDPDEEDLLRRLAAGTPAPVLARQLDVPLSMVGRRVGVAVTRLHRTYHDDRLFRRIRTEQP